MIGKKVLMEDRQTNNHQDISVFIFHSAGRDRDNA